MVQPDTVPAAGMVSFLVWFFTAGREKEPEIDHGPTWKRRSARKPSSVVVVEACSYKPVVISTRPPSSFIQCDFRVTPIATEEKVCLTESVLGPRLLSSSSAAAGGCFRDWIEIPLDSNNHCYQDDIYGGFFAVKPYACSFELLCALLGMTPPEHCHLWLV